MLSYRELKTRKFGIELEVSASIPKNDIGKLLRVFEEFSTKRNVVVTDGVKGWADTHRNNYWHVKYDSTCGFLGKPYDFGWEIASFIGTTSADLEHIGAAAHWLNTAGLQTNHNCGLHFHIDVADFAPTQIAVVLARWLKIESWLLRICDPSRTDNEHCLPLRERYITRCLGAYTYRPDDLLGFWERIAPVNLEAHCNSDKKYTLNTVGYRHGQLVPSYSRKTVEFRFPECVLSKEHIQNWGQLLLNFIQNSFDQINGPDHVYPVTSVSELMYLLGLSDNDRLFILSEELLNTKLWLLRKLAASPHLYMNDRTDAKEQLEFLDKI